MIDSQVQRTLATLEAQIVALRETIDERDRRYGEVAAGQAAAVAAAFAAAKEAVLKAEVASEKRFEAVNEFRGQLNDQAATFITRTEAEQRMGALGAQLQLQVDGNAAQIAMLMRTSAETQGHKVGSTDFRTAIFGTMAAVAAVASIILGIILAVTR